MSEFTNLKVVFTLHSEMIIPRHPIPFDALLMKAMAIQNGYSLDLDPHSFSLPELPIARHPQFSAYYLASIGFILASGRNAQFYTKRFHGDIPQKVDITGGFFKAYHVQIFTLSCPITVTFYCRGEKTAIEQLVLYIPALGSKRSQGYGKVKKVTIEEIEEDRSWIYKEEPMRAIPVHCYPEKLNDWYYTATNPIPPSYISFQTDLCYLPRPSNWLSFTDRSLPVNRYEEQFVQAAKGKRKSKRVRKIWGEWERE
jgi:hypothetical protein